MTETLTVKDISKATAIFYIVAGLFGLVANFLVIWIKSGPKTRKRYVNVTYSLMVQLAICDSTTLVANALAGAVFLLVPDHLVASGRNFDPFHRIFGYLSLVGWFVGSVFLCLIAFSRYICITRRQLVGVYFSAKMKRMWIVGPWLFYGLYYSTNLWYPETINKWHPESLSWNISPDTALSKFYEYQSLTVNLSSVLLLLVFNILTFAFVLKTRRMVASFDHERHSHRQEIKLFSQCAINCCLYIATIILFNLTNVFLVNCRNVRFFVIALNFVWILHHCCNPIIYFILNREFRKDCLKFVFGKYCISTVESEVTVVVAKNARQQRY